MMDVSRFNGVLRAFRQSLGQLYKSLSNRTRTLSNSHSAATQALTWICSNRLGSGGIRVQSGHTNAYPEVTGYLLPTLIKCGEFELAADLTRWLLCVQRADGSVPDPDLGKGIVFDTGQVLRGLLAATTAKLVPGAREACHRAANYLVTQMVDGGDRGFPQFYRGSNCPESVHLYVLPPLIEAASVLQDQCYREAAQRCLDYYIRQPDFLSIDDLTHFLAYELEALIDLGRFDLAQPVLDRLREEQEPDGSVRGIGGVNWVCTPGLAQLAICWYKLGQWEPADKAMNWLEAHQESDGGFKGSYGPHAAYKQVNEIAWAPKFYLDAHFLRVAAFFQRHAAEFPTSIAPTDGRVEVILKRIRSGDKVLEVGCGKGRFLSVVKSAYPDAECTGVDPSPSLQRFLAPEIKGLPGTLEANPCSDESFDVVFSVEAIEHSISPKRALEEMIRVAKPGGWVIIVDKQQAHWGRLACPPWERWPELEEIRALLNRSCDEVSAECVAYDNYQASDGLIVAWCGRKRSRLSGANWNTVLISTDLEKSVVDAVRFNRFSEWGRAVLLQTKPSDKVLEIGSGTGQISLQIAQSGRAVTCLDISNDSLEFSQRCASHLGVKLETVCADAMERLPFADRQFDCVWSSGLLEHFTSKDRQAMLREWARVSRGKLINLVPNAGSLAYRVGKMLQERRGAWPYGLEMPLRSLREDYEAVGLQVTDEFPISPLHALNFLSQDAPLLCQELSAIMQTMTEKELVDWNQGYLLMTIGMC